MEKQCIGCNHVGDSNDFKATQIGNHWYIQCPDCKKEYEIIKSGEGDWSYMSPPRSKPNKQ